MISLNCGFPYLCPTPYNHSYIYTISWPFFRRLIDSPLCEGQSHSWIKEEYIGAVNYPCKHCDITNYCACNNIIIRYKNHSCTCLNFVFRLWRIQARRTPETESWSSLWERGHRRKDQSNSIILCTSENLFSPGEVNMFVRRPWLILNLVSG